MVETKAPLSPGLDLVLDIHFDPAVVHCGRWMVAQSFLHVQASFVLVEVIHLRHSGLVPLAGPVVGNDQVEFLEYHMETYLEK